MVFWCFTKRLVRVVMRGTISSYQMKSLRIFCLEITEVGTILNPESVKAFVRSVKALGVKIALDDFGAAGNRQLFFCYQHDSTWIFCG